MTRDQPPISCGIHGCHFSSPPARVQVRAVCAPTSAWFLKDNSRVARSSPSKILSPRAIPVQVFHSIGVLNPGQFLGVAPNQPNFFDSFNNFDWNNTYLDGLVTCGVGPGGEKGRGEIYDSKIDQIRHTENSNTPRQHRAVQTYRYHTQQIG